MQPEPIGIPVASGKGDGQEAAVQSLDWGTGMSRAGISVGRRIKDRVGSSSTTLKTRTCSSRIIALCASIPSYLAT
jgi:hypothetical protein